MGKLFKDPAAMRPRHLLRSGNDAAEKSKRP